MQVVCGNCQLSFQAPEGATGLVCPICRSPLRAPDAPAEPVAAAAHQMVDWNGGTLDDLVSLLSGPAWSARVEVLPVNGGNAIGEVHVIAGGVSDALFEGKSTHEALDKLRAARGTRFRIEPRLPNPSDGNLTSPGPEQGKLEERPLANLMRYCEEYVLTAGIEVWRGSENAKVDYRRGEIVGVTVGGIDAPERLAEVMKWSSGSYRLIAPKLSLPETAPKAPAPAAVAPPRVAAPMAVSTAAASAANRTIFGMPALDPTALAAAAEKIKGAQAPAKTPGMASGAPTAAAPAPQSPSRTSTPAVPVTPARQAATSAPTAATAPPVAAAAPPVEPPSSARQNAPLAKTIFGVQAPAQAAPGPAPVESPPPATVAAPAKPAAEPQQKGGRATAPTAQASRPVATTTAPMSTALAESDRTTKALQQKPRETPVWTYVGVGFIFGLALLGVYRLVIILAH